MGGIKDFIQQIKDTIAKVKTLFGVIKDGGIARMFDALIEAVKGIPERIGNVGKFLLKLAKKVASYEGYVIAWPHILAHRPLY